MTRLALAAWAVLLASEASFAQVTIEGLVTNAAGRPLPNVDLDFFETQSGTKVDPSAPGWESQSDKTDFEGRYSLVVIPEVYDIRYEPPVEEIGVAPVFVREIFLGWDLVQDVALPDGSRLTGRVLDVGGTPVAGVDLNLHDPATGIRIATVRDDTDSDGWFDTTVRRGEWNVVFRPPAGSGSAAARRDRVDLSADARLDVSLPRGHVVSGRVTRPGGIGVRRADLDFDDTDTRRRVPTSDDATASDGTFQVVVPEGTHHVFVTPPPGFPFAPTARYDIPVFDDVDLGTLELAVGVLLRGDVAGPGRAPVVDADVDLYEAASCRRYPLSDGFTGADGSFAVRVEIGTYDIIVNPPLGAALATAHFESVSLTVDLDRSFPLGTTPGDPVGGNATVLDAAGVPQADVRVRLIPLALGSTEDTITGADGTFRITAAHGRYRLELLPADTNATASLRIEPMDFPCGLAASFVLPANLIASEPARPPNRVRAFPNPSLASTRLSFSLDAPELRATVTVYDLAGRRVRVLYDDALAAGDHEITWDGSDVRGTTVPTGVYFVRLAAKGADATGKIVRMKP